MVKIMRGLSTVDTTFIMQHTPKISGKVLYWSVRVTEKISEYNVQGRKNNSTDIVWGN